MDADQKMTEPHALLLGCMLEEFNLVWLEEPVAAHDHAAKTRIVAAPLKRALLPITSRSK